MRAENAALREKLNLPPKTPDNSSTPPSQGKKPFGDPAAIGESKGRRTTHPGAHRPLHPNPTEIAMTPQYRYRRHWFAVGRLLMAAASSESLLYVMLATDALTMALEIEGWITRRPRPRRINNREIAALKLLREIDQPQVLVALAA